MSYWSWLAVGGSVTLRRDPEPRTRNYHSQQVVLSCSFFPQNARQKGPGVGSSLLGPAMLVAPLLQSLSLQLLSNTPDLVRRLIESPPKPN
jgi:hypothetical protein